MADLIDRTELRRILRDNGLYSTAVRHVIEAVPAVEDDVSRFIITMQADITRMGKLNESLRMANSALVKENQELKKRRDGSRFERSDEYEVISYD